MKKIRIHNDIDVRWAVTTNGEDVSLEGRNLSLSIENMFGRKEITDYTVVGNVVRFVFHGAEQRHTGLYVLVLQDTTDGMRTVDKVQAFELVRHTIDQNGADDSNITTETVELTSDLTDEQKASLKGDKGDTFTFDDLTDEQKASLKGDKGEALTFDDLTPEQIATLQSPATDAAAEVTRRMETLTSTEAALAEAEAQREASVHNALEDIAEASGKAETATAAANTAAALANQKATAAQTATDACNTATTNANDATAAANTATTNAVAATEAAVTAKQNADAATAAATSATGLANTATEAANTAAAGATTAKQNADAATALANQAALNWEKNW